MSGLGIPTNGSSAEPFHPADVKSHVKFQIGVVVGEVAGFLIVLAAVVLIYGPIENDDGVLAACTPWREYVPGGEIRACVDVGLLLVPFTLIPVSTAATFAAMNWKRARRSALPTQ